MSNALIRAAANIQPEMVFLPPALFGYAAYLREEPVALLLTGVFVASAAAIHDIAVAMKERDDEPIKYEVAESWPILNLLATALLVFGMSGLIAPIYGVVVFVSTYDLYLGVGLLLYIVLAVKLLRPFERYQEEGPG